MNHQTKHYDICIIGGGINGAGIARDAAGRGLSTLLVEAKDLAQATSSASTKLIHGGLRYLEYYEFKLVRHALQEREVLLKLAPHIIWPLRFKLPHDSHLRPKWLIRMGLFLYDHIGGRITLPKSKQINFNDSILKSKFTKGFEYSDGWVQDSRLVVLNAMSAREHGADILTQTSCTKLEIKDGKWLITLEDNKTVTADKLVNATGPWVRSLLDDNNLSQSETPRIRLVKGSHIIIPKLFEGDHAYILQQPDGRIVFAIPYEQDFTLIGTTDESFDGNAYNAAISEDEKAYLITAINSNFKKQISQTDIIKTYSGVRPLLDDGDDNASAVTRDYKLILDNTHGAPILSVFGGKVTTYRRLAEDALDVLTDKPSWTAHEVLPGGDIENFDIFVRDMQTRYPDLSPKLIYRLARNYGTRLPQVINDGDLGTHYGDDIYESEISYLIEHEWARSAEDVIWRRSKLDLHISDKTRSNIERRFQNG